LLRHCAANQKGTDLIPNGVIRLFHWHNGPGVDSGSNVNEYEEYFLGGGG
jgi:hypothetical protein